MTDRSPRPRRSARSGSTTIRTVADLAQLDDADLALCFKGLRRAIQLKRSLHLAAVHLGEVPANAPVSFDEYVWHHTPPATATDQAPFTRETPIRELPLSNYVRGQLLERNVYALEDVSALSESELHMMKHIGPTTVTKLREMLHGVGLDFSAPENPVLAGYERNRRIRGLPEESRQQLLANTPDSAPISNLGLRPQTLKQCNRRDFKTVGDLRAAAPRTLRMLFGKSAVRELYDALLATGEGFKTPPQPLELWIAGLRTAAELDRPTDPSTPIRHLQPWLGATVFRLAAAGVDNLGALEQAADRGGLVRIPGLGTSGVNKALEYLGRQPAVPKIKPSAAPAPAKSIFDLASRLAPGKDPG